MKKKIVMRILDYQRIGKSRRGVIITKMMLIHCLPRLKCCKGIIEKEKEEDAIILLM